jgi:hypothetical protein
MTQHRSFQIKAMFFQVTESFLDPHSATIKSQSHSRVGQIGGQAPGFFLADFPMHQQVDRINFTGGQISSSQPEILTGLMDVTTERLPTASFIEPDTGSGFLAQDIEPIPFVQLTQERYRAKFAVSDQKNSRLCGDQLANIGQQSQLLPGAAVSSGVFDPGPGNWDGSFPVLQTDDQQLMTKANFAAIDDQTDFSQMPELSFQPLSSDGFVLFPNSDGGVIQQPAQAPGGTQQLGWTGDLPGNAAQTHRPALIDASDQPDHIADLGDPLPRSQFLNSAIPCIIEVVDRHWFTAFLKWFRKTNFSGETMSINYSVVKVSGS